MTLISLCFLFLHLTTALSAASPTRSPTVFPSTGSVQTNPTRTPPRNTPPPTAISTVSPSFSRPSVEPTSTPTTAAPSVEPTAAPTDKPTTHPSTAHQILDKLYGIARNKPLVITGSALSLAFLMIVGYVVYARRSAQAYAKLHRRTQSNSLFSPIHTTSSFSDGSTYHRVNPSFSSVGPWDDSGVTNLILDRVEEGNVPLQQGSALNPLYGCSSSEYATLKHMKQVQNQERLTHRMRVEIPGTLHEHSLKPEAAVGTLESRINNTPNTTESVAGTDSCSRRDRLALTSPRELQLKLFDIIATTISPQDIRENTVDGRILQESDERRFQRVNQHMRGVSMPTL